MRMSEGMSQGGTSPSLVWSGMASLRKWPLHGDPSVSVISSRSSQNRSGKETSWAKGR